MKTYVCDVSVYDFFLKLKWQRRVQLKINMKREKLNITKTDEKKKMIQSKITLMKMLKKISIVEINDRFDAKKALQIIINETNEKKKELNEKR